MNNLKQLSKKQLEKLIEDVKATLKIKEQEQRPELKLLFDYEKSYIKRTINILVDGVEYRIFVTNGSVTSIWVEDKHTDEYGIERDFSQLGTVSIKAVFGMTRAEFFEYITDKAEYLEEAF